MTNRWLTLPLRLRLVAMGVIGLLVGFAAGGLALVVALHLSLQHSVDRAATKTAGDVAELIETGELPSPVPTGRDATVVQVFDEDGRYETGSVGADPLVPLLRADQLAEAVDDGRHFTVDGSRASMSGTLRVTAVEADGHTVIVAVSQAELSAVGKFAYGLTIMLAVLAVAVAALLWWTVGRTLRPVDAARVKQREFVADAAHELRSPLANMRTELEVAARIGVQEGLVEDLLTDVERMARMTEDLLLLARLDDARRPWRFERLDLTAITEEVIDGYADARVRVGVDVTESPVEARADRDAVRRVITNLTDNAVRHAETAVTVGCATRDGAAVLTVCDDGPGIPAPDRARVFDRFTRLDDARARDEGGTGLGLSIVAELVATHQGTITLSDAEPHGLCVRVRFPRR